MELAFNCFNLALATFVQGASIRPNRGSPQPSTILLYSLSTVAPITAYISIAKRAIIIPSLSVVHTVPSFLRNDAPADSSPPMPISPSNNRELKYLKPTGTSYTGISLTDAHLSIMVVQTTVLPTPLSFQPRVVNR